MVEQKGLDRPELREKIVSLIIFCSNKPAYSSPQDMAAKIYCDLIQPLIEEAKRQERERIQKAYEGEWYSVTDTYCPEWIVNIRQALKGEK